MKRGAGDSGEVAAGHRWVLWVGSLVVAAGLAGCGGGGGGGSQSPPPSGGNPPSGGGAGSACTVAQGTGSLRVTVTDAFGEAVTGANVFWVRPENGVFASARTDAAGVASLASLPACEGWVEVNHTVRGLGRSGDQAEPLSIRKDGVLEVPVRLEPIRQPAAAVVSASVGPGGVSGDGRSLDVMLRIAVTGGRLGESWLLGGEGVGDWGVSAASCEARTGTELAELGPRCIRGPDGSDVSYSFGRLNDPGVVRQMEGAPPSRSVGLLIDQGDNGLGGTLHAPNDPRLFAARFLVDDLLPDVPLALAAFASDLAPGGASTLPQRPVTFFPVEAPGFTTSRSAAFETLHDLSDMVGGGSPLYEAIAAGVDFMAARTPVGRQPILVVLADGGDRDCGTPAECSADRRGIIALAKAEGVKLFLAGTDAAGGCSDPYSDYCLELRAQEPLRSLAAEGGFPLVVSDEPWFDECGAWGPCPAFAGALVSPLELVSGWLSGTAQVQDVSIRLTSESPGAFAPGAVVTGELFASNPDMCPWDCWRYSLPFRVEVPE